MQVWGKTCSLNFGVNHPFKYPAPHIKVDATAHLILPSYITAVSSCQGMSLESPCAVEDLSLFSGWILGFYLCQRDEQQHSQRPSKQVKKGQPWISWAIAFQAIGQT